MTQELGTAMKLVDGHYMAMCRERNALAAAMNGHGAIYPQAMCEMKGDYAIFCRDGHEIWRCNAAYAEFNVRLEPVAPEAWGTSGSAHSE
jgi:hypothetical protein